MAEEEETTRRMTKHNEGCADKFHGESLAGKSPFGKPGKVTRPRFRMMLKRKCKMQSGTRGDGTRRSRTWDGRGGGGGAGYDVDTKRAPFASCCIFQLGPPAGNEAGNGNGRKCFQMEINLASHQRGVPITCIPHTK